MPIRPFSMRETLEADQPSRSATSLPCSWATSRSSRSSRASLRSRTDGLSFTAVACTRSCNLASHLSSRSDPCHRSPTAVPVPLLLRRADDMALPLIPVLSRYDLYDIAFLTGGAHAVVDTAVVALVESGRVRLSGTGTLRLVDATRHHPVEAAVLDGIGSPGARARATVRPRAPGQPPPPR